MLAILGIAFFVFILTQPYALIDWYEFGRDVIREGLVVRGWIDYPYTRQFASTVPYLYQIVQSTIWGMGVPLGLFTWMGASLFLYQYWRNRGWRGGFVLSWALVYFILIGAQYAKYPRYMLPLLPILYVMATQAIHSLPFSKVVLALAVTVVIGLSLAYSVAIDSIYGREHPWIAASRWIYEIMPPGSTLAVEEWDDSLPVQAFVRGEIHRGSEFKSIALSLYGQDDARKIKALAVALSSTDLVVIASQRAYGSLGRLPVRYPLTSRYYEKLFGGELGFELAESSSNLPQLAGLAILDDPSAGLPFYVPTRASPTNEIVWNWGFADESVTVYDHPQPLLFRKSRQLSGEQLYNLLIR